ncbi:MAG: response regulator [Chitinophagaceae bacterium]|nr:response regulator [Chitinophagaceae bacterium]
MTTILLIEDSDDIRENTAEILELAGYSVHTAANGKIGVELAQVHHPDLIICDIMMPVLDGYGVLHLINKNADLSGIPFIFLTAKSERSDFRKGMEMGADDYITKPFDDIELLNAIESRLKKVKLLKKEYEANAEGLKMLINDFSGKDALQNLVQDKTIDIYKKRQTIYSEGNLPRRLFYLQKGKIKTYKTNDNGRDLTVGLYSDGDFFGYTAILEDAHYKETAETIEESEVVIIAREEFDNILKSNPNAALKFIKLLAKNVSEKEEQLLALAYNSLRKKVADSLLVLQRKYKKENTDQFSIHISREDLANIAGTATESLIRTLSDFKTENLIEIKDGKIYIINEKKLANLIN